MLARAAVHLHSCSADAVAIVAARSIARCGAAGGGAGEVTGRSGKVAWRLDDVMAEAPRDGFGCADAPWAVGRTLYCVTQTPPRVAEARSVPLTSHRRGAQTSEDI